MTALQGLAWLLLCQSAGEAIARLAHLPLPGPVVGMLLLVALRGWRRVLAPVGAAADTLLTHLSLLFVPVGVGVGASSANTNAMAAVSLTAATWVSATHTESPLTQQI